MNRLDRKTLCLIILVSMFLSTSIGYAEIVWFDNFDDNEADGWEMDVLDFSQSNPITGETAEYDTSSGTLKSPSDPFGNIWYLATHESTQDYGTWSFDVKIVDTSEEHFYVFLMSDDWATYPKKAYTYDLIFITGRGDPEPDSKGGIVLFKRNGWSAQQETIGEWGSTEEIVGWHHIDVTRDPDGVFDVYLDEESIIHVEEKDPASGLYSTFRFESLSGPEIDNVLVLDTYVFPHPEPPVFEFSTLAVDPESVAKDESVTVTVECSNVGLGSGSHSVILTIDGEDEDEKTVSLDPDDSTTITFQAPTSEPGTYSVEIEGLTGSYEVKAGGVPGFPVESLIAGLAVAVLVLWFLRRRS